MAQAVQKSKGTIITVALLPSGVRLAPTEQTLTLAAGGAAANAVALTLTQALTTTLAKGQYLTFKDANGFERLAQASETVSSGTSVPIYALKQAIAAGATTKFPVKLQSRTAANVSRNADFKSVVTFDSGGERDGTTVSRSRDLDAPGNYLFYDAGIQTCLYAYENDLELWVRRILPKPTDAWKTGRITEGPAAITDAGDEAPADSFLGLNLKFSWVGELVKETEPELAS